MPRKVTFLKYSHTGYKFYTINHFIGSRICFIITELKLKLYSMSIQTILFSTEVHSDLQLRTELRCPERLTTSALQVSVLEHLALDIVRGVEHHQVQVHLVAPVPVPM